jgi:uncharacterized membrane protein YfcA
MWPEILIVLPLSFIAGAINAAVGGGGLIAVPALFATFPDMPPASLLGSDKASAVFGHVGAMRQYALRMTLPWRLIGFASAAAFCGALLGALAVHAFPPHLIRPVVVVLLAAMFVYTVARPNFGRDVEPLPLSNRRLAAGLAIGFVIGLYDGFFGPGTGSFLVFLFVRMFRFDFLRATACAKVVNLASNCGALVFFIPAGAVVWPLAIPLGLSAWLGGLVGARMVMRGGNLWLRRIFLVLSATLLVKLVWEAIR